MAYSSSPKADDGQRSESESCQSIEGFGKLGMIVKTALRNRARDQPSAPWWYCRSDTPRMYPGRVQKLHVGVRDLLSPQQGSPFLPRMDSHP